MAAVFLFRVTLVALAGLAMVGVCQAACRACPFQWNEHQGHCYRYFPGPLSRDDAAAHCQRHSSKGGAGGLMTPVNPSADEAVFLIDYVEDILDAVTRSANGTGSVWLSEGDVQTFETYNMVYHSALGSKASGHAAPCDAYDSPVAITSGASGVHRMVTSPEVVEQGCSVYTGGGAHIDLGDFAGTCVSDPSACASGAQTWSLWLQIDPSVDFTQKRDRYFISVGGYTSAARGIAFLFKNENSLNRFMFMFRSGSWSTVQKYETSQVPIGRWFHLAVSIDLSPTSTRLASYVDGKKLDGNDSKALRVSPNDGCTRLFLGDANPCGGSQRPPLRYGGSAAYSNLMVFDQLLSAEQIANLHACGSLDWDLKLRSLYIDSTYRYSSGSLRYVCTASASAGPAIYWRRYDKERAEWRDLGRNSTEEGAQITPTSFSPCVVQSSLVIGPSEGDTITCTATTGSRNASASIRQGREALITLYSSYGNAGLFVANTGPEQDRRFDWSGEDWKNASYPFICRQNRRPM